MSFITSASGSTDLRPGRASASRSLPAAAVDACFASPRICAMHVGERIDDRSRLVGAARAWRRAAADCAAARRRAHSDGVGPDERRRRVVDADLLRPVLGDEARSPTAIISRRNAATIASETMPTRVAACRRRQASVHRPGDTVCGISRGAATTGGISVMSLPSASPHLSCTRGSTALYIRSASRLMIMVATATYTVTALITGKSRALDREDDLAADARDREEALDQERAHQQARAAQPSRW